MECLSSYLCNQTLLDNIKESCENPMFSGMDNRAVILNYNSIDKKKVVFDSENSHIVRSLGVSSALFIVNARQNPFTGTNTTVEVGDYKNTFTKTVSLYIPMDGANASKSVLDPMSNGKFVVILKNNWVNDLKDNEYQIYGLDKGLVVSSMTQTKYENNDYWLVELQESGVMNSGRFLDYDGKVTDTRADVEVHFVDEEGTGRYYAKVTIGSKTYMWDELTGNPDLVDLEANSEDPSGNENWQQVDGNWVNKEYHYPDYIKIADNTYELVIPAYSIDWQNDSNGNWLLRLVSTEEYLCGLLPLA